MSKKNHSKDPLTVHRLVSQIAGLEKKFNLIVNHAESVEIWVLPDKSVAFVSSNIEQLTGYPAEHFLKNPAFFSGLIHPDDLQEYIQVYETIREHDLPAEIDRRIINKDGQLIWIHTRISKIYDDQCNFEGFRSSTTDITRRKEAELKLEEAYNQLIKTEEKYRIVADHTRDMERWVRPDGSLAYISPSCEQLTGYSREEFMKGSDLLPALIHPDDLDYFNTFENEMVQGINLNAIEVRIIPKNGGLKWIEIVGQFVYDKDGNYCGLRSSSRDITGSVLAKNQLQLSEEQYKAMVESQRELISELKEKETQLIEALAEVQKMKLKLEQENIYLRQKTETSRTYGGIIADSVRMHEMFEKAKQVAVTDAPVLLVGETGTGKEMIAQAIHDGSKRNKRLMVTVNCAALPSSLIESELFGREKGAYTGALSKQIGRFELAHNSTIFLDEIGELPLETQVKLLRIIQFGEFQLLGSPETKKVDVRIIAATNKNLSKAVSEGTFRNDLFYRLNVFPIFLPPLRERREDIPSLVFHFIDEMAQKMGKRIEKISSASMNKLMRYNWPGNVRELRNIIEYNMILAQGSVLEIALHEDQTSEKLSYSMDEEQRRHIEIALNQAGWRIRGKDGAAERLGMKESTLRFRMKKLGIERKK